MSSNSMSQRRESEPSFYSAREEFLGPNKPYLIVPLPLVRIVGRPGCDLVAYVHYRSGVSRDEGWTPISLQEWFSMFPDCSERTLRSQLSCLVRDGFLERKKEGPKNLYKVNYNHPAFVEERKVPGTAGKNRPARLVNPATNTGNSCHNRWQNSPQTLVNPATESCQDPRPATESAAERSKRKKKKAEVTHPPALTAAGTTASSKNTRGRKGARDLGIRDPRSGGVPDFDHLPKPVLWRFVSGLGPRFEQGVVEYVEPKCSGNGSYQGGLEVTIVRSILKGEERGFPYNELLAQPKPSRPKLVGLPRPTPPRRERRSPTEEEMEEAMRGYYEEMDGGEYYVEESRT